MRLNEWRKLKELSCADVARMIGLEGDRDGSSVWNWEAGRARPDADVVQKIIEISGGEIAAGDMHATRLAWLRDNGRDRLMPAPPAGPDASQAGAGPIVGAAE